jgi:beta propeller repeat protein
MKSKILLLLVAMILLSTSASAGTETRIVNGQRLILDTEIGNHLMTWYENSVNGLHIYDLNTKQGIDGSKISNYNWDGVSGNVEVYNNYAVWCDMSGNIMLYDSSTNTATQIDAGNCYNPVVYGSKIFYDKDNYICVYDIGTQSRSQFLSQGLQVADLYGNKVVGTVYGDSWNSNVYIADIGTQQMSAITTNGHGYDPQINGNVVVWTDSTNAKSDVYMRDINAHKTSKVSTDGHSTDPKIYGNRVVYISGDKYGRSGVNNVFMYDKSTGKTTQITTSGTAACPSIYENNIIYEDFKNADTQMREEGDIYLYSLSSSQAVKPVPAFTASKTYSATHPVTITFTYTGTGTTPITCKWTFGDGTSASTTAKTISHKYSGKGIYTVSVTATNKAGSSSISKKNYITVK